MFAPHSGLMAHFVAGEMTQETTETTHGAIFDVLKTSGSIGIHSFLQD